MFQHQLLDFKITFWGVAPYGERTKIPKIYYDFKSRTNGFFEYKFQQNLAINPIVSIVGSEENI